MPTALPAASALMAESGAEKDDSWIRVVVRDYEPRLLRYALNLTRNQELARDVVQDAFLRLCREEAATVQDHLAEWLYTVCRRRAIDLLRKEKRMTPLTLENADRQVSREGEASQAADNADLLDGVGRLLAGLSANQQEVVRLKFQGGLSYREISNVTELSVTNVGYLLHTAIQKIRAGLQEKGELS